MHMYDDIIPNDDRINLLFNDGFDKIKIEQKRFFRLFLGQPGHSIFATPDLRKKHMKLPISIKEAKYWLEDFELALDRIDIAFVPVDPRLGVNTLEGVELFYKVLKPKLIVPMHFSDDYSQMKNFIETFKNIKDVEVIEIDESMKKILE